MAKEEKGKEAKGKGKDDVEVEKDEGKASGGKKKILLIVSIVLGSILILAATIGATVYFVSKPATSGKKAKAQTEQTEDAAADGGEEDAGDGEGDAEPPKAANYVSLDPAFVVNFEGSGPARFLQISVEVMTRNPAYAEHIKKHMPVIRNNLVLLFSSQTYDKVNTLKGKEDLRQAALAEVQKILAAETGDPGVEALYFTSFVMQ